MYVRPPDTVTRPLFSLARGGRRPGGCCQPAAAAPATAPRTYDAAAPRTRRRAGVRRPRVRVPGAHESLGLAAPRPQRGRPRRHVPGPFRAQRVRRGPGQAAHRPRSRRRRPRLRSDRPVRGEPGHHRELPHRAPRRGRRAIRADRRRLAGAGRRAVLPGDRAGADGTRAPPSLRGRGSPRARHRGRAVRRRAPRRRPRRRARRRGAGAPRVLDAAGRARTGPHRDARRHRRHDPGRAGRDHPLAAGRACSSSRVGRAPARRWSRCTAPRTCSTPTGSRSRTRACS